GDARLVGVEEPHDQPRQVEHEGEGGEDEEEPQRPRGHVATGHELTATVRGGTRPSLAPSVASSASIPNTGHATATTAAASTSPAASADTTHGRARSPHWSSANAAATTRPASRKAKPALPTPKNRPPTIGELPNGAFTSSGPPKPASTATTKARARDRAP